MSNNLVMLDYSSKDPRSVRAMLQGRGDAREQIWLAFQKRYPEFSTEVLMEFFSREVRYGRILPDNILTRYLPAKAYLYLMHFVAIIL